MPKYTKKLEQNWMKIGAKLIKIWWNFHKNYAKIDQKLVEN